MALKVSYQKFKNRLIAKGLLRAPIESPAIVIVKGKLKIIYFNRGIDIYWDNSSVTRSPGLNVAVSTLGLWTNSTVSDWQLLKVDNDSFKFKVVFRDLPLNQIWTIKILNEFQINWRIDTEIEEWLYIDEFRILSLVGPDYKSWINGYKQGDFFRLENQWKDLCMDNKPTPLVGVRFPIEGEHSPSFAFETQDGLYLPVIQNPPQEVNAHIVGFRYVGAPDKRVYTPGTYPLFSGKINLFENEAPLDTKIEILRKHYLRSIAGQIKETVKPRKKLKILLVNLPWQRDGSWGVRAGSRWPHIKDYSEGDYLPYPFFLAYATSLLQKHGIDATLIDCLAEQMPEDLFIANILEKDFDYLVAETSVPSLYYDLKMLKTIASMKIPIILCGPNAEIYQPQFLDDNPFIDFILYAEYEFTLLELVKSLQEGKGVSKIHGLIYRDKAIARKNPPRPPFDIDLLPWPYREGLPMEKYLDAPGEMLRPSVQMLASRGCPFKCQFCLWPQVLYLGHHYRARNIKDVVDEMEYLVKVKGFKSVYFDDDTFNIGKERMLDFCRLLRERGLDKVQWAIMARPDLMDEEILENMKRSGLWAIKYGVESANQNLLDNIGKGMDLKRAEEMIKLTKGLGIRCHLTFTFGLPGETKKNIDKTIRYALELDPFSIQFSITTPFPGTQYYDILAKRGSIISKDFSLYDGHFKSVIKLEDLTAEELEIAKIRAYRIWEDHFRKKRGFLGEVKRFVCLAQTKGLRVSLNKTKDYLKYIALNKREYLNPNSSNVAEK